MNRKPRSPKHRNLTKRGGVWYYQRVVGGRRYRKSLETGDLEKARGRAAAYEQERGIGLGQPVFQAPETPLLQDFAERYLAEMRASSRTAPGTTGRATSGRTGLSWPGSGNGAWTRSRRRSCGSGGDRRSSE